MANLLSFLTFSLLFLPFSISSSPNYTFPKNYFINCGSNSPIDDGGATNFSGDLISDSGKSQSFQDPTTTAALAGIYKTARKFTKSESYKLPIQENRVYMVRLHFFPSFALRRAKFNVSASGYLLLSNFSMPIKLTSPVIKEFLVPVVVQSISHLEITFIPFQDPSSFAFVNAIEAFATPQGFIPNSTHTHVTPRRKNGGEKDLLLSSALTVIHRINVGGSDITPERDTMRRTWVADDDYLHIKRYAKNHSIYSGRPKYDQGGGATEYDAPDFVYKTAKEMNLDVGNQSDLFNVTWVFDVRRNATFFVRLHFCDIVSDNRNDTVFNVYIYGLDGQLISPYDTVQLLAAPFYVDFLVDSDGSGFMNISVGPRNDSKSKNAFLNGVEIMELINDRGEGVDKKKKKNLLIIVGYVVGGVVVISVFIVVVLFCLKSRKGKPVVENSNWPVVSVYAGSTPSRTTVRTPIGSTTPDMNLGLKIPFAEILYATNKFDPSFMIGEGGFGKVYKGTLHNGVKVAVKRSEAGHGQGLMEFQTEITLLSKIRHQHLVSLIGYCAERDEMILVYEFMEKGTLREHLYSSNEDLISKSSPRSGLSWDQRLQMCIGAANALQYLHTGLSEPIIHRDIKSTNILLDEHDVAKVADFGLSKSGPAEETHIVTDVKGSFGYLDPEYMKSMQLTQKSDVYSFGVVLLEVLCARPAVDNLLPRNQINLAEWGLSCLKENKLEDIIDPFLVGKINPNSLRKFGETAEKCLQENGTDRPNMMDVLWDLNYARQLQHPAVSQESHGDTTNDVSWQLALPGINRLPSIDVNESCASVSESDVFFAIEDQ